jgi:hypothetical protein
MRARIPTAFLALALVSGCAQITDQMEGAEVDSVDQDIAPVTVLETVEWAELEGLVSVLVHNPTQRMLRRAEAVITVHNAEGEELATSQRRVYEGPCCTAIDVPPGGTFGFYLYTGDVEGEVEDVEVTYKNTAWGGAASDGGPVATAVPVQLSSNSLGTLAFASVTTQGGPVESALVQAVLEDPEGSLVAIISGTWTCFHPGTPAQIRMQLYQTAPPDTRIRSVTVYPDDQRARGGDGNLLEACDSAYVAPGQG